MDIGIGLPSHAPWTDGRLFVEWARRAEARGFSTLGVSDRLLWSTPEPLITLAAAAGATSRIRLLTSVILAPLHSNHLLFAKAVATLDQLAGPHRLQLGLAAGFRRDDFTASGVEYTTRGTQFSALLDHLTTTLASDADTPHSRLAAATPDGPPLLFGGTSQATLSRIATYGVGWVAGTSTIHDLKEFLPRIERVWADAGRSGAPRVVASVMFALGPNAEAAVSQAIGPYYAFAGREWAQAGISSARTTPEQITATLADFEQTRCDELIFTGNDPSPDQVDLLADAIGL